MSLLRIVFLLFATQGLLVSSAVQFFLYSVPIPGSTLQSGVQSISSASTNSLVSPFSNFHFQLRNVHDGSYHFGYDAEQSYREEKRDASGAVAGRYGYLDPNGIYRMTEYRADANNGYRANQFQFLVRPTPIVSVSPAPAQPSQSPPSPATSIQVIGPIPKPISQFF